MSLHSIQEKVIKDFDEKFTCYDEDRHLIRTLSVSDYKSFLLSAMQQVADEMLVEMKAAIIDFGDCCGERPWESEMKAAGDKFIKGE